MNSLGRWLVFTLLKGILSGEKIQGPKLLCAMGIAQRVKPRNGIRELFPLLFFKRGAVGLIFAGESIIL
jgi:hypothetical protein